MTRVAYLISEYPAPSHTFIRREIEALRKRGLTIVPFSVRPSLTETDEPVPSILESQRRCLFSACAMVLRAPAQSWSTWRIAQSHRAPGIRGWFWAQFHVVEAWALAWMLRRARVNHLHSHFANSGAIVGMLAAHCLKLPWSLTLHGISETDHPAGALLPDKLRRARFVVCASWFMRAQAMRVSPPDLWSKFHVIRCAVDLSKLPLIDEERDTRTKTTIHFVTVGRLSAEKGHTGLLEAFEDLFRRGIDACLTIVGDGPLRAGLADKIAKSDCASCIVMTGALTESRALAEIAKADVFVLPSLMEGLPVVLMEAMALRKPVIAPWVAGIPELVSEARTGLLFRPGDWAELGRRMRELAADATMCRNLGERGRKLVETEFEIDTAVAPLENLFRASAGEGVREDQFDQQSPSNAIAPRKT